MKPTLYEIIQNQFKKSGLLVTIWVAIVFMSSLITVTQGISLITKFYKNNLAERESYYQKLQTVVPGLQIGYISEVLGSPAIINSNKDGTKKEYVFVNKFFYLQAITRADGYTLSVAVTSRDKSFQPSFSAHGYTDKITINPSYKEDVGDQETDFKNLIKIVKGKGIVLNKTTFSDVTSAEALKEGYTICRARIGANRFSYSEETYLANPGNYQTIIIASNDAGNDGVSKYYGEMFNTFFENMEDQENCEKVPDGHRSGTAINTFIMTAPFVSGANISDFTFGADLRDVKVFD